MAGAPHIDELHNSPTKFISGQYRRNRFVKTTNQMKLILLFVLAFALQNIRAQDKLVSEPVLQLTSRLMVQLPASIHEAYAQHDKKKMQYDSLEQLFKDAYPALADKMKKRSARLNSMAGYNADDATLSLVPANQKMADFFRAEWEKMDALEKSFNQQVKSFYGKDLYKAHGYLNVWDSVYKARKPSFLKYRDGILKLVQTEIAYLRSAAKMFSSADEAERMQYVEAELSILQKLALLRDKYKRVITEDGVDKVTFCKTNPDTCK